ncbi:pentatricopeptide repeat-containing protein [Cocos nucifera]|uniref:Pentatricopeptide repeat-containing protein n=1 Tax=Cocos nucifera TaxID=13894 RepID=A0A8K0N2N9_COCNU|nr:pentatricopeptide repeat-containing protein [Cocos nucifera]
MRWTKEITPAQVLQLIRAEPDPRKALLIFDSATAEYPSGFRHDLPTFSLMATRLAAAGLLPAAESLLERVPSELGRPPSEASFLVLLRAHGRAHRPLDALRLFRQAPTRFRLHPSHRSYTALLAVLVAENRLALARGLYNHMREAGVPPTVVSYNVLLKALCSAATSGVSAATGTVDAALRVFGRMPDRGCPPDSCSYNTLIDGLCKIGRVEEAQELFRQMDSNGCSPTVVTYTTLIHGLCRSDRLEEALKVFDEMGQRGVDPNIITYSSLVDGLCKGGRSLKAMVLLDRMVAECRPPNTITYSSIIHGLCKEGRLREAVEVLDSMRLQGRKPDAGLYGKLIKGLCDSGRFQEAANYLDEMVLSGISPNRVTWSLHMRIHNMVVVGLCAKNVSTRAFQVYQSMRTRSISTETETFHFLVECFCKKGDVHKAARIVSEMLLEGCVPYQDTWRIIMGGYWERRKVREAAELMWDQLVVD